MPGISGGSILVQAAVWSTVCLAGATARRNLVQATLCGELIPDVDVPGPNLEGSGTITGDNAECVALCEATEACNASIRVNSNGACFIKAVDVATVVPISRVGMASVLLCPDGDGAVPPVEPPLEPPIIDDGPPCGELIANVDIPGTNLPGSGTTTASNEDCLSLCELTDTCNAAIRVFNGDCFLKSVDVSTVVPTPRGGLQSYLICDDSPDEAEPPVDENGCGEFVAGIDIPGPNLPGSGTITASNEECLALCVSTATCNAAIRNNGVGHCFLKSVDVATVVPSPVPGLSAYLICGGTGPSPPDGAGTGTFSDFFGTEECPATTTKIGASCNPLVLAVPQQSLPLFDPSDLDSLGRIVFDYIPLVNGEEVCFDGSPGSEKVLVGGSVVFKDNGVCQPFPTKEDGSACCKIWMWQPNNDGYYNGPCSAQIFPDSEGAFWFRTEVPGSEAPGGWGPDPDPHFHFDVECGDCAPGSVFGVGPSVEAFCNKFYIRSFCADPCGATEELHFAQQSTFNGEETYKYNIVVDIALPENERLS